MEAKNVIGVVLVLLGIAGIIPGVISIFEGGQVWGISPWAWVIIGVLMFFAGISLMKSIRAPQNSTTVNKVE